MGKKYDVTEEQPLKASEAVGAYNFIAQEPNMGHQIVMETSNSRKKEYLAANLHPATAEYLESVDWMEDKPFPVYEDSEGDTWIDEAEAVGNSDIVGEERISQDRAAWFYSRH